MKSKQEYQRLYRQIRIDKISKAQTIKIKINFIKITSIKRKKKSLQNQNETTNEYTEK